MEVNMQVRRIAGSIATTFIVSAAAFAQAAFAQSEKAAPPSSTQAENAGGSMTVVGCLIREADYRKAHNLGKGALGGVGLGDEFVLVDAMPASNSTAAPSSGTCTETGAGKAYRTTGKLEEQLKPFVGHRIEVTGQFDHERDAKTAAGETDAKLPPEIRIASYRAASGRQAPATASAAPASPPAAQQPPVGSAPQTVASNQAPERQNLPKTATNEPLIALIGLMCLSAAFGVHFLRVRTS
jgi:LPXTG-motif cell wall-anchored protein